MARKHVSTAHVLIAAHQAGIAKPTRTIFDLLTEWTGQPFKVCLRAVEREEGRRFLGVGCSLNFPWLTDEGSMQLLVIAAATGSALPTGVPVGAMYRAIVAAEERREAIIRDAFRQAAAALARQREEAFTKAFLAQPSRNGH